MSCAFQQRVRNRQPDGGLIGVGTSPSQADAAGRRAQPCHVGHGREQRACVGVRGLLVDLLAAAQLDDLAEVHDGDPLAEVPDHGEVVGDEDEGEVEVALQVPQQVDDLCLDGDVQGGDGLVGDDQLGLEGQRAGDADALALAAGELVRVAVVVLGVKADDLQQLLDPLLHATGRADPVDLHRHGDDPADGVPGVQRGVRVLEDDLHVLAAAGAAPAGSCVRCPDPRRRSCRRWAPAAGPAAGRWWSCRSRTRRRARSSRQGRPASRSRPPRARSGATESAAAHREVLRQPLDPQQRLPVRPPFRDRRRLPGCHQIGHCATPTEAMSCSYIILRCRSGRWQATTWPGSSERSSGSSCGNLDVAGAAVEHRVAAPGVEGAPGRHVDEAGRVAA